MPHYYPVFLDLRGKRCLIVGGNETARQKAEELAMAGAETHVVSPIFVDDFPCPEGAQIHTRGFVEADLDDAALVICAAEDEPVQRRVAQKARERGILVNVVDVPPLCDFVAPAMLRRGPLCIAVSSGGASPSLAGRLSREIGDGIGPEYGALLELLREFRQRVHDEVPDLTVRSRLFKRLSQQDLVDLMRDHGPAATEEKLHEIASEIAGIDL